MRNLQKVGGITSLVNAGIAVANGGVVFGVLGPAVAAGPARIAAIVTSRPLPLLLLEVFKVAAALTILVTVLAIFQRLQANAPRRVRIATSAGLIAVFLLLSAGIVGAIAIRQAGSRVSVSQSNGTSLYLTRTALVNGLGLAAVFANGWWYLLISVAALKTNLLPRGLCYLGLPLGVTSLVAFLLPPLTLLVLLLSFIWSVWLGVFLLREPAARGWG